MAWRVQFNVCLSSVITKATRGTVFGKKLHEVSIWKSSQNIIDLYIFNVLCVASYHIVIAADVSTGFGVGGVCVHGLAKKASVFSHCLKLENCYNEDIWKTMQERCANLGLNWTNSN